MDEQLARFKSQLQEIWGNKFNALRREPKLRGTVGAYARPFEELSEKRAERWRLNAKFLGKPLWEDDLPENLLD